MQATFHDFFHRCIAARSSEMCLRKPFTVWLKISPKSLIFQTLRAKRAMFIFMSNIFDLKVQMRHFYLIFKHCDNACRIVVLPKSD